LAKNDDLHLATGRDFQLAIDSWVGKFLEHRIADRRVLRLINKWMSAGVIEEGTWSDTTEGAPQGASLTPPAMLQNGFLSSR